MTGHSMRVKLNIILDYDRNIAVEHEVSVLALPRAGERVFSGLVPRDVLPLRTLRVTRVCHLATDPDEQLRVAAALTAVPESENFDADVASALLVDAGWSLVDRDAIAAATEELESFA